MPRRPPIRANAIANGLRRHQIQVFRFAQHLNGDVQRRLVGVRADLVRLVVDGDPTEPTREGDRLNRIDAIADEARRQARTAYRSMRSRSNSEIVEWAGDEQHIVAQLVTRIVGVEAIDVLPARALDRIVDRALIQGSPASEWWSRQADGLAQRFKDTVREGTKSGESVGQIIQRVRGTGPVYADSIIRANQSQAEALVRSSVLSALHDTRVAQFKQNDDVVEGWAVMTTFDSRTCPVCMAYSGALFDFDGDPLPTSPVQKRLPSDGLPLHMSCRCCPSPVLVGEAPPQDLDFETWLTDQPEADQKDILGPQWWAGWKDGTFNDLRDRIDQRGRPVSLKQLRAQRVEREAA
jgi:SPP1 gp7 family putative phage head morphogenesis protein